MDVLTMFRMGVLPVSSPTKQIKLNLNFAGKSRRALIEYALVHYEYIPKEQMLSPTIIRLVDMWEEYVTANKEDIRAYQKLKTAIIGLFGEVSFQWTIDNTYLLHQVQYLERKGIGLVVVEREEFNN